MDVLIQDLRYAYRALRRSPGYTAVVGIVMALGIGVNVMMFGLYYSIISRPWPLPDSERIVYLGMTEPKRGVHHLDVSWQTFHDLRDRAKSFESLGGFWDAIAFWDSMHGILLGDPVDGRFTILTTSDGTNWQARTGPKAEKGEAAFAAAGTALVARGAREAWFATGGPGGGRVFHSEDGGATWSVARTPLRPSSDGAGIFSLEIGRAHV